MKDNTKIKRKEKTMDKVASIRMNDEFFELINYYKDKFNAKNIGETIRFLIEENSSINSNMQMKLKKFYLINQTHKAIENLVKNKNSNIEILYKLDEIIEILTKELHNDN